MTKEKVFASPWKRQRELKKEDIPEQEHIIRTARRYQNLMERSLFIMTYLTGGRISEIVEQKYLRKNIYRKERVVVDGIEKNRVVRNYNESPMIERVEKIPIDYKGIRKRDILFKEAKGRRIMIVSMQNRKNKQYKRKNIPIPIDKESELVKMIIEYLNRLAMDQQLFPIKIWKAEQIIGKAGYNPHFLRDIRLTHMVTIYEFNAFQLVKFAGWKNVIPAERYVRLGITDLVDKY